MSDFIHVFERGAVGKPTILSLHGTGGSEHDLLGLTRQLFPESAILSPRGKISERGANRFFRRLAEGVFDLPDLHTQTDALSDFVAQSAQKYDFDANNVVAIGYSNGANIAASLFLQRPETLSGAVLLRAMTPFEPEQTPDLDEKQIFMAIGRFDPILPLADAQNLAALLSRAGAKVQQHLADAGHELTNGDLLAAREWRKLR